LSDLKKLLEVNQEILKWVKFTSFQQVKTILEQTLYDDNRKLVYYVSDGKNTREVIANMTPISEGTVSNWWKSWAKYGIINLIPVKGGGSRGEKIFELEDFDISIPKKPDIIKNDNKEKSP